MVGGGYDGTYYGEKGNENILSALGNSAPFLGLAYDNVTKMMKRLGGTKCAGSPTASTSSSPRRRRRPQNFAGPARGSTPSTSTRRSSSAPPTSGRSSSASRTRAPTPRTCRWWQNRTSPLSRAFEQNGVSMKSTPDDRLRPEPARFALAEDAHGAEHAAFLQTYKPVEIEGRGHPAVPGRPRRRSGSPAFPTTASTRDTSPATWPSPRSSRWARTSTREDFARSSATSARTTRPGSTASLTRSGSTASASSPAPGASTACRCKDGKFVVVNKGKPVFGKLVGSPDALAGEREPGNPDLVDDHDGAIRAVRTTMGVGHMNGVAVCRKLVAVVVVALSGSGVLSATSTAPGAAARRGVCGHGLRDQRASGHGVGDHDRDGCGVGHAHRRRVRPGWRSPLTASTPT